ncbi:hypothetical protein Sjap_001952 [Stephania japonica]|uniref:Uncharacterized protein n=1 Tax=Stephania japonica TaxID=461633 RepID=A0AAP0KN82_9MAGN
MECHGATLAQMYQSWAPIVKLGIAEDLQPTSPHNSSVWAKCTNQVLIQACP